MGSGSSVYAISSKAGIPLAQTQAELTPLQRQVLELSIIKEAEQMQEAANGGTGTSSPQVNSAARPGGGSAETTTYVNVGSDEQE